MLDRPILVTGSPRSGKTLVAEILAASPEFYFACEPLLLWDAVLPAGEDDRRTGADASPMARDRLAASLSKHVRRSRKARYVDDLAQHALRIPFIAAALPEARIVHVIRDARSVLPELICRWSLRDTVRAAVRRRWRHAHLGALPRHVARFARNYWGARIRGRRATWGPRVPGLSEFVTGHSVPEAAAFQWRSLIEIARRDLAELPSHRWMEVRHERLVADPAGTAMAIARFAEAADPAACVRAARRIVRPAWRDPLACESADVSWERVGALIAETQHSLSYAHTSPAPPVPTERREP